ncbi:MAG: tetratricopeptide repeat protein, partial [Longimicrobiales bacterium]
RVVAAIELELQKAERTRAIKKNSDQLDVYELTQRAYWHYAKRTKEHNDHALQLFGAAMDRDPLYVPALTGQAACHFWAGQRIWTEDAGASLRQGLRKAQEAVALDDQYATAQLFLAQSLLFLGRHEAAVATVRRALQLNPSYAGAWAFLGHALTASGRFEAAVRAMQRAFELTSHDSRRFFWLSNLALARFHLGDHEGAAREAREAVALQPDHWLANQVLMMALALTGRADETEPFFRAVRTAEPNVTLHDFANRMPYRNPADLSSVVNALRRSHWTD